jgi:two-component system, OmpR family, sensor histidine kinase ChvG
MTFARSIEMGGSKAKSRHGDVLLGEDFVTPESSIDSEIVSRRNRSGFVSLNSSPLARKIVTFNLVGLILLVTGVLYLNPFRDSLVTQHERGLVAESQLIANVIEGRMVQASATPTLGPETVGVLQTLTLTPGSEVFVFDQSGAALGSVVGKPQAPIAGIDEPTRNTVITNFLNAVWEGISSLLAPRHAQVASGSVEQIAHELVPAALAGTAQIKTGTDSAGHATFTAVTPVRSGDAVVGVVAVTSAAGEIDLLVRNEREQVLQMFVIAILVSIGLSLVLASTIANPLSDLAAAAELGRDKNARKMSPSRVRIPDLAARPDEIGRLSVAMRGMVTALYDRIEANEQFAADVAHEIKNPLASLRSAVASMRIVKRDDQREKLLGVIEHDVRRLDRLVSDISNASRLDSELVKEDEESFNLVKTLTNLTEYLGKDAAAKKVDFITDLPPEPIIIQGLEGRLAQVFVNLITNAVSFCEEGDAVRVWARKRENRVLVVVEDTGPGIPEQALTKVFKRFYSERPPGQFGDHSGLGLAISKQIVEAHGGVIWAENIRPTDADPTSDPLGARFVVGLPV